MKTLISPIILTLLTVWSTNDAKCNLFLLYSFENGKIIFKWRIFILQRTKNILNVPCLQSKKCFHIWSYIVKISNSLECWNRSVQKFNKHCMHLLIFFMCMLLCKKLWVNSDNEAKRLYAAAKSQFAHRECFHTFFFIYLFSSYYNETDTISNMPSDIDSAKMYRDNSMKLNIIPFFYCAN